MEERLTARELYEWAAFEGVFGPLTVQERIDAAGAVAAYGALIAAGAKDIEPRDLLPDWSSLGGDRQQTADEMIAVMRGVMASVNSKKEGV